MTNQPQETGPEQDELQVEASTEELLDPEIEERLEDPGESRRVSLNELRLRAAMQRRNQQ